MLAEQTTLDIQNNLTINVPDDHSRDYWTDRIVGLKQVNYWPNFVRRRNSSTSEVLTACGELKSMKAG
jgi:hypothetical protein